MNFSPSVLRSAFAFLLSIILGFVAQGLWVESLIATYGWNNTNWGNPFMPSIFIIIGLLTFSYLLPFLFSGEMKQSNSIKVFFFMGFYLLTFVSYFIGSLGIALPYSFRFGLDLFSFFAILLILILLVYFFSTLYQKLSNYLIGMISNSYRALFVVGIIASLILSTIQVMCFPGYGSVYDSDLVDAVKMGYPFFWISIVFSLLSIRSVHYYSKNTEKTVRYIDYEDILDV